MTIVRAFAPGRVNLIGEYTDLVDGHVLPCAIDLGTAISGERGGGVVELRSTDRPEPAIVPIHARDPMEFEGWARHVAGVVAALRPRRGFTGQVRSTVPIGAGLSSSAALAVAVTLALGFEGRPEHLADLARRAEQAATGVPCGIMDQLASVAGVDGHALLIDCATRTVRPVPVPDGIEIRVVDSGIRRSLASSAYAEREASIDEAGRHVGPLTGIADPNELGAIDDPTVRRRARHIVTEEHRVRHMVEALRTDDRSAMGAILREGQASLRDDLEVSTPVVDELVTTLTERPGVIGARMTGAGFGGAIVLLAEAGSTDVGVRVRPSAGAFSIP